MVIIQIECQKIFYHDIKNKYKDESLIQLIEYDNLGHFVTTNMMDDAVGWFRKWSDARENYPDKWLLFEAIEAYSEEGQRIIKDISVINIFDDGREALKEYSEKHKKDKTREMYVYHTKNKELIVGERNWIGIRKYG